MVDHYRAEFRMDLQEIGVDLAVWWRDRRWLALYELFSKLPDTCRTRMAIAQDPRAAEAIARADPAPGKAEIPLSAIDPKMVVLLRIYDRLADLTQATLDTIPVDKGKARPRYRGEPLPVEKSAVEIARLRYQREIALHWTSQFFPHSTGFA
jgi:hypothetical protein